MQAKARSQAARPPPSPPQAPALVGSRRVWLALHSETVPPGEAECQGHLIFAFYERFLLINYYHEHIFLAVRCDERQEHSSVFP